MRRLALLVLALCFAGHAGMASAQRLEGVGVVLMHAKRVTPPDNLGPLRQALEAGGARVLVPEMSWSAAKALSGTFEEAMDEIDGHVRVLRERGASRIVVVGHGMGGNAALGYAARRRDLAAVVVVGPGHTPDRGNLRRQAAGDVDRARRMIRANAGDAQASFFDLAPGNRVSPLRTSANAYFSWYDPNGVAVLPRNARALRNAPLPLLYVVGNRDPLYPLGSGYAFDIGRVDPRSRYVVVQADRAGTPTAAAREIVAWLGGLGPRS